MPSQLKISQSIKCSWDSAAISATLVQITVTMPLSHASNKTHKSRPSAIGYLITFINWNRDKAKARKSHKYLTSKVAYETFISK